jgi:peptidoglycan/LPS O-acetylase OafA/YrhL
VIYLSSGLESGRYSVRSYAKKRAVRILPPYLVALALAYVVDYAVRGGVPLNLDVLVRNLLFTVESSSIHGAAGYHGNPPLWTLSYEVWFYIFFAVMIAAVGRDFERLRWTALAIAVVGFVSVWVVPNPVSQYAVLLVIWWAGAELAHEWMRSRTVTLWGQRYGLGLIVCMMALTGGRFVLVRRIGGTPYPRTALVQLLIAAIVLVAVVIWQRFGLIGFRHTIGLFLVFGPISYGIYLFHYPINRLATDTGISDARYLNFLWVLPAVLLFSWLFDYRLHRWILRRTSR